jgi:WD40 repeat protein
VDGTIRLWDVENGREIVDHFKGPTGRNGCLAVSPDGHRLLSGDGGGRELRYWNVDTGTLIQKLKWGEHGPVTGLFTPDGRHSVWAVWGGLVRMYRLRDIPDRPSPPPRRLPDVRKRPSASPRAPAHGDPGKALRKSGEPEEPIAEPGVTTAPKPDDALAHNRLGTVLQGRATVKSVLIPASATIAARAEVGLGFLTT